MTNNTTMPEMTASHINYVCDHFRSLEAFYKSWLANAVDGDADASTPPPMQQVQAALKRLALVFKHFYVLEHVVRETHSSPVPPPVSASSAWGCFDDAVADDDGGAPSLDFSQRSTSSAATHRLSKKAGHKRVRDENDAEKSQPAIWWEDAGETSSSSASYIASAWGLMDATMGIVGTATSPSPVSKHTRSRERARVSLHAGVCGLRELGVRCPEPASPPCLEQPEVSIPSHMQVTEFPPLFDMFIYERFLPLFGIPRAGEEVVKIEDEGALFEGVHPLRLWLRLCELGGGGDAESSVLSEEERRAVNALLEAETQNVAGTSSARRRLIPPLPLLLPIVMFVVLGFHALSPLERRLLQLLRRERRKNPTCSVNSVTRAEGGEEREDKRCLATRTKHEDPNDATPRISDRAGQAHLTTAAVSSHSAAAAASAATITTPLLHGDNDKHVRRSGSATPASTSTYVKTKRGVLSLVCEETSSSSAEDEEDDETPKPLNQSCDRSQRAVVSKFQLEKVNESQHSVSKALDFSQIPGDDENAGGAAAVGRVEGATRTNGNHQPHLALKRSSVEGTTPLAAPRVSVVEVSDDGTCSPPTARRRPPRPPHSSSDDSTNEEDEAERGELGGHSGCMSSSHPPTTDQLVSHSREDPYRQLHVISSEEEVVESSSDSGEEVSSCSVSLCSRSSDNSSGSGSQENHTSHRPKRLPCAKCKSTKGDRYQCPRCKLFFHEKCNGPHPQDEGSASGRQFSQLLNTISSKDLGKAEIFAQVAANFWGPEDEDSSYDLNGDDASPQHRRLALAATLLCLGCCDEQGLAAYRVEPDATPSQPNSGDDDDEDTDDDDLSTDSSDIRAAEVAEALDVSRLDRELALVKGSSFNPHAGKGKVSSDHLLLTQATPPSKPQDRPISKVPREEFGGANGRAAAKEERRSKRGSKYVLTEAEEVGDSSDSSASSDTKLLRSKAEPGYRQHKKRTEVRVKRIREERRLQRIATTAGATTSTTPATDVVVHQVLEVSPDTSQMRVSNRRRRR